MAFSAFGIALIMARIFNSNLPDQFGVALIFVLILTAELFLMWFARTSMTAFTGLCLWVLIIRCFIRYWVVEPSAERHRKNEEWLWVYIRPFWMQTLSPAALTLIRLG